jgi:signal transduction histidine kinase
VGEKPRLDRVMRNLVENALRHGPSGSAVTIAVRRDGECVFISVDDEGAGIEPDLAGKLFDKFAQGRERSGKAGLGLYFCRVIVEHWGEASATAPVQKAGVDSGFACLAPYTPETG